MFDTVLADRQIRISWSHWRLSANFQGVRPSGYDVVVVAVEEVEDRVLHLILGHIDLTQPTCTLNSCAYTLNYRLVIDVGDLGSRRVRVELQAVLIVQKGARTQAQTRRESHTQEILHAPVRQLVHSAAAFMATIVKTDMFGSPCFGT